MKLPGLRLRLATSKLIRHWAQRQLPNGKKISGQILNSKTVNYNTLKPEKNGLFCERIFGPIRDFTCACGRQHQPLNHQRFCPRCEVDYVSARVRRYRLGYIQLITAVAHTWFFKNRLSYFSIFLNLSKRKIESLLYCTKNISRTIFPKEFINLHYFYIGSKNFEISRKFSIKKLFFYFLPKKIINLRFWKIKKTKQLYLDSKDLYFREKSLTNKIFKKNKLCISKLKRSIFFKKKSIWHYGGVRDSAIYFGFSLIAKNFGWQKATDWFSFAYFLVSSPQKKDILNKFYPGPPGFIYYWGLNSKLHCFAGIQIIRTWLSQLTKNKNYDGRLLEFQIRLEMLYFEKTKLTTENEFIQKINLFRRFKYLRLFRCTKLNPAAMVLNTLPVLPPDLRPIIKLNNNQIAISDFNKLYQDIIYRNKRLLKLASIGQNFNCLNSEPLQYAQRLLQESIDFLIDNNTSNKEEKSNSLKSLSDIFKGKKGRFRQNLLGKRVDYSGRSVIVVGPYLKIYECGLPKEIAYELFQPFLLRILMLDKQAQTIIGAKKIFRQKPLYIFEILKEIVHSHPILLNRAPTLHRLGIQAFQPCLIEGKAILLHPLVCSAFNADFDGDQMGVHLPLCFEARAEAWKILWSRNNLFSVATGSSACLPSQDIILGSSFLTTKNNQEFGFTFVNKYFYNKQKEKKNIQKLNFLYDILFKKPIFFKTMNTTVNFFYSKKNELIDANLLNIQTTSLSKEYYPFFYSKTLKKKSNFLIDINNYNQKSIWCSYNSIYSNCIIENKEKILEIRVYKKGYFQKFRSQLYQFYHSSGIELLRKLRTTVGRIKFHENTFF